MFNTTRIDDAGIPLEFIDSEERMDYAEYIKNLEFRIDYHSAVLSNSVRDYEKNGQITANDYLDYLEFRGLHDESVLKLIKHGFQKHCDGDYITSIHILIPQIEYTLRKLLEQQNVRVLKPKKQIIQYVTLYELIDKSSSILDDNFIEFLKVNLVSRYSKNLRNKICHGLYEHPPELEGYDPLHNFSHTTSLSLILIIMFLTKLSIRPYR